VSVEVVEFEAGVTDVGDREQVANAVDGFTGDGVTAQDSTHGKHNNLDRIERTLHASFTRFTGRDHR
jgi:hypothetical protein